MSDDDHVPRSFRHFAEMTLEHAPLYAALSARVAEDESVMALARCGQRRQPPPNLLFGVVHFLLLSGAAHPLSMFYPSLGGSAPAHEAWPAFVDFCQRFRAEIEVQVRTRRVQTNEVGRCALMLPAIAMAAEQYGRALHLVEIGASAGLNLNIDRYQYEYSNGHRIGSSPAVIRTELRGAHVDALPLPAEMPAIADRLGIDIEPIDVHDADAMLWTEALLWPSDPLRSERYRAAVGVTRAHPPCMVRGDGLERLPEAMATVGAAHVPCIMHSHAIYQMDRAWREQFHAMLEGIGAERDLVHVSLEWLGDDPGPELHLTTWRGGVRRHRHVAHCHPHGRWLEPLAEPI